MSIYHLQNWGWFQISLLEVKKDKDEEEDLENKQELVEDKKQYINFLEPFEEFVEESIIKPEKKSSAYKYIVFIGLIASLAVFLEYLIYLLNSNQSYSIAFRRWYY